MARTKLVSKTTVTVTFNAYDNMSNVELKKLIDERKMEGRSKLTTKAARVEALTYQDAHPGDKIGLLEVIQKHVSMKASKSSKEESQPKEEGSSKKEKSSSDKGSDKPKVKKSKKNDWVAEFGINREEYPPGTRFVKSVTGKIKVHYPKGHIMQGSEESEVEPDPKQIELNKENAPKLIVKRVNSKPIDDFDLDAPLEKKKETSAKKAKKAPAATHTLVDPDETEEEDPKIIEQKKKELARKKIPVIDISEAETEEDDIPLVPKKVLSKPKVKESSVEQLTTQLFGMDLNLDPMEDVQDESEKQPSLKRIRDQEEQKEETEESEETEEPEETEETEEKEEPKYEKSDYTSKDKQEGKDISQWCGWIIEDLKKLDLKSSELKNKAEILKELKDISSIIRAILY